MPIDILDDFICYTTNGLYCSYGNFYLDPKNSVVNAVITHAHGDHATKGNLNVYCTQATQMFMLHRYRNSAAYQFHIIDYKQDFYIKDIKLSFYPAGHILGSAMVLMEYKNTKYLYTGDYKLQEDLSCEKIELTQADVLITESTFANPEIKHPNIKDEIMKLKTVDNHIMLGSYALGKSQRLIQLINQYQIDKKILVHHTIYPLAKIYEKLGISLGDYQIFDRKLLKFNAEKYIYIVPPIVFNNYKKPLNMLRVFASGWDYLQKGNGLSLYISDHVDWKDILQSISLVNPKEVWTIHGNGEHLKSFFKDHIKVKILN